MRLFAPTGLRYNDPEMVGRTVSHYRVLEKLGQGGMGVVYKAEDTRLKRIVALKFLPAEAVAGEEERARFAREAQAAAALDHPNICTVYEIDEAEGRPFIAMACIEGQSLKARLQEGPLRLEQTLDLAAQVAEGLQAAHEKGVVHRDIKSANIMITEKGQAKIMDFGLAQLAGQTRVTRTGSTLGTPAYMSPEQAQGNPVDHRSDLWSLVVVLHEMAAGQLPFKGGSEVAVLHSILYSSPEPLSSLRSGLPLELERIVRKALAKRPAERYQHAADLLVDLRGLAKVFESGSATRAAAPASLVSSIAVLPFANLNRDEENEFFADGITEELISALSKVEQLRVVSRTSAFQFKGQTQDIREIGQRLQVSMALEGSVRRAGARIRVTAQLVSISDGLQIWSERYDRELKDVFEIQDEISLSIVEALKIQLAGGAGPHLVKRHSENLEAYQLYLKGQHHFLRWSHAKALECFQQAIALDPQYASAWAGLAATHGTAAFWGLASRRDSWQQARAAVLRALELDDSLAEAHYTAAYVKAIHETDWVGAERHFRRALDLARGDPGPHYWYATGYLTPMGRLAEAEKELERALELDPLSLMAASSLAWVHFHQKRLDRAIQDCEKILELDPNHVEADMALGCCCVGKQRYQQAEQTFERVRSRMPDNPAALGWLGWCYGGWGKHDLARQMLGRLEEMAVERPVSMCRAWVYMGLDEIDRALDCCEQAYEEGDPFLRYVKASWPYEPLQSEPRFQALLKRMGLQ